MFLAIYLTAVALLELAAIVVGVKYLLAKYKIKVKA